MGMAAAHDWVKPERTRVPSLSCALFFINCTILGVFLQAQGINGQNG